MPFTNEFKDRFVAPEISVFTSASIRDLSAVSAGEGNWLRSYLLNTATRAGSDGLNRQTLYNFLRRAETAFSEYKIARSITLSYLNRSEPDAVSEYLLALSRWEVFLSQTYQAWCLLVGGQKILFEKDDGSSFQRLNLLYNRVKHVESAIASSQIPEAGMLPVWLKNDGLHSVDSWLTFDEIAEILEDLARFANGAQDPTTMKEKVLAAYALEKEL